MISTIFQAPSGDFALVLDAFGKKRLLIERRPYVVASIKIRNRLKIWLGEWFADLRIGVPYIQKVLVKNPDSAVVRRIFTDVIMSMSPIVKEVRRIDLVLTGRDLKVTFEALADNDQIITGGFDGLPFIVQE